MPQKPHTVDQIVAKMRRGVTNSVPGLKGKIDLNALAAEMIAMETKKGQ